MPLSQKSIRRYEEQDAGFARQLVNVLRAHGRICRSRSLSKSAEAFHALRVQDGATAEQVRQTLDWYLQHFSDPYVPHAHTADEFRTKFAQIQSAILRQQTSRTPIIDLDRCKISPAAVVIASRLRAAHHWPGRSSLQLEGWLQANLVHFTICRKIVLENFAENLTLSSMWFSQPAASLAETWSELINQQYASWKRWNGDLLPLVWSPSHKHNSDLLLWHGIEISDIFKTWQLITQLWKERIS